MAKLHELLAVEGDLDGTYRKILEETTKTFKTPAFFNGWVKRVEWFDPDEKDLAPEIQEVTETVPAKLDYTWGHIIRYLDAVLQKEATNQEARADLEVDGAVLMDNVPATFLLALENKLKLIREIYLTAPTLQPGIRWEKDESKGNNIWRREAPEEKYRTAKTFQSKVLYEATKEHPAQIEKWEETRNVGKYVQETWSGMISSAQKSELIGRVDKLIRAAKTARQRANRTDVKQASIGKKLMGFIHNGVF